MAQTRFSSTMKRSGPSSEGLSRLCGARRAWGLLAVPPPEPWGLRWALRRGLSLHPHLVRQARRLRLTPPEARRERTRIARWRHLLEAGFPGHTPVPRIGG